jgi:hypothetical protein
MEVKMRINTVITEQPLKLEGLQDVLSKLNVGDIIKAKVLEMTSGELLLKLFDGTVLKASTLTDIDASPGSQLELEVKGRVEGKLILETVKGEAKNLENQQNEVKSILQKLDIEPESQNFELASEIKSSGLKATRQLFDKASELLQKFSVLTPDKAVFLSSKNISPEQGNINTLLKLVEGSLKLGSQLDDLLKAISTLDTRKALDTISNEQSRTDTKISQTNNLKESVYSKSTSVTISDNDAIKANNQSKALNSDEIVIIKNETVKSEAPKIDSQKALTSINQDINNGELQLKAIPKQNNVKDITPETQNSLKEILISKDTDIIKGNEITVAGMSKENDLLPMKDTDISNIHKDKNTLNKLIESFKELFVKIDSDDLKNDIEVKRLYGEITDKLENIKETVNLLGLSDKNDISAKINSIEDGIKLLNQFNNNSTYVQIPLNISGYNTTGELYIMKKEKSKKRIDPQNVVMLIALDTRNIGHIETLIDVKGKNVGINLRAEDQKIIDFLKENYRHLYGSLSEKGFKLVDVKYRIVTEKVNLLNAEHKAVEAIVDGKTSLDVKV